MPACYFCLMSRLSPRDSLWGTVLGHCTGTARALYGHCVLVAFAEPAQAQRPSNTQCSPKWRQLRRRMPPRGLDRARSGEARLPSAAHSRGDAPENDGGMTATDVLRGAAQNARSSGGLALHRGNGMRADKGRTGASRHVTGARPAEASGPSPRPRGAISAPHSRKSWHLTSSTCWKPFPMGKVVGARKQTEPYRALWLRLQGSVHA